VRRDKQRNNVFFYGGLAVLVILLYGGATFLQSVNSTNGGRPFEVATDIVVAGVVAAFAGRKFGIGWGVVVGVTIAAFALITSRR
jgi:hypothetical protein